MRRWAFGLAMLAACADPSSIEVRVAIRDLDLEAVALVVGVGDAEENAPFIDCVAPADDAPTGTCPFEGGDGRWTDPDALSFVVYGEPDTPIAIAIDGLRMGRSVTATRAYTALPDNEGERRILDLALLSRTSERSRCDVEIPAASVPGPVPADANALSVFEVVQNRAAREVVASANGNLAYGILARTDDECEIRLQPFAGTTQCSGREPVSWCHVRAGAMAVGPQQGEAPRTLVGAVCASPFQLAAAYLAPRCAEVRVAPVPAAYALADVSDPVVLDVDADGDFEVVVTALDRTATAPGDPAPMAMLVWHPERADGLEVIRLGATRATTPFAPLVVPTRGRPPVLVIVAQTPALGLFVDGVYREAPGVAAGPLMRAPALVAGVEAPGVVRVTEDAVQMIRLVAERGGWRSELRFEHPLLAPLTPDLDVRVAIGKLDAEGPVSAVLVDEGDLHAYPLEADRASVRRMLWGKGVASGAQYALLANVDGAPGAEVLSFSRYAPRLAASALDGRPLEGWPITMTSQTGRRHVVVTDLDGPVDGQEESIALRDIELVTLSDDRLGILTLGPGSYDRTQTPWPMVDRDPLGAATYFSELDPAQFDWRFAID